MLAGGEAVVHGAWRKYLGVAAVLLLVAEAWADDGGVDGGPEAGVDADVDTDTDADADADADSDVDTDSWFDPGSLDCPHECYSNADRCEERGGVVHDIYECWPFGRGVCCEIMPVSDDSWALCSCRLVGGAGRRSLLDFLF